MFSNTKIFPQTEGTSLNWNFPPLLTQAIIRKGHWMQMDRSTESQLGFFFRVPGNLIFSHFTFFGKFNPASVKIAGYFQMMFEQICSHFSIF